MLNQLTRWWFEDLPPLDGRVRFLHYGLLLALHIFIWKGVGAFHDGKCAGWIQSLHGYEIFQFDIITQCGLFAPMLPYTSMVLCLSASKIMRWSWFFCAIGLGGKLPRFTVAIAFTYLHGHYMCEFGASKGHEQFLTLCAGIALCFANDADDCYSVDYWLKRAWRCFFPSKEAEKRPSAKLGCAARKFVLCVLVIAFFFSGVHKLSMSGLKWMNGQTIVESAGGVWNPLGRFGPGEGPPCLLCNQIVRQFTFVPPILATTSVVFECGAFLAIFPGPVGAWRRALVIFAFISFHIGIKLVMHPNFAMNIVCYLLAIDWGGLLGQRRAKEATEAKEAKEATEATAEGPILHTKRRKLLASCYTVACVAMCWAGVVQCEAWPASSWMLYPWHPDVPGWGQNALSPSEAVAAATHCVTQPSINPSCMNLGGNSHMDTFFYMAETWQKTVIITDTQTYVDFHKVPGAQRGAPSASPEVAVAGDVFTAHGKKGMKGMKRTFREGLFWRTTDAIAQTIAEGLPCLEGGRLDVTRPPSVNGAASRLARQFKESLSKYPFFVEGATVEAVAIFWTFADPDTRQHHMCMVGTSRPEPTPTPVVVALDPKPQAAPAGRQEL